MRFHVINTARGLVPAEESDYELKLKLKLGETYDVEVKVAHNLDFFRKFWALLDCAWECLPESQTSGFGTRENFRQYLLVCAHYTTVIYHPVHGFIEIARSMKWEKMSPEEFSELYANVRCVIDTIFLSRGYLTPEQFDQKLLNF